MAFIEPISGTIARIKVVGVGGAGQNAVSSMVDDNKAQGVEFIAMNTDLQALNSSSAQIRLQLGPETARGLGSGANPRVGYESAVESMDEIKSHLQGSDMVFIVSGFGGGTGTGAGSSVAQAAKEIGALTVGVIGKPFEFEGKRRMTQAEQGIRDLKDKVDALIVIPNQRILDVVEEDVPLKDAFKVSDEVIGQAVEGISDLITSSGLINVDFADVKTVMTNAGSALMGIGYADGEGRAVKAAEAAVNSKLLDIDINGSTGILINIVGDNSLTMHEVNTAAKIVTDAAHDGANIIFGANIDPEIEGVKVTVIATGFDSDYKAIGQPEYASMSGEEVIEQLDSRFDSQVSTTSPSDSDDESDEDLENFEAAMNKDVNGDDSNSEFDISELRKEVEKMDAKEVPVVEDEKNDEKKDDERSSFLSKSSFPRILSSSDNSDVSSKKSNENGSDKDDDEQPKRRGSIWKLTRDNN